MLDYIMIDSRENVNKLWPYYGEFVLIPRDLLKIEVSH